MADHHSGAARALGIDLGGTKILAAVVDAHEGTVLGRAKRRTRPERGADTLVERTVEAAREAMGEAGVDAGDLVGACAAIAGQIDREAGVVRGAPNLASGVVDLPLAARLGEALGLPVALANDVEGGAVGEARHGAGLGYREFVAIFVGTGVGGAIVEAGVPRAGVSGTAGEIGHMIIHAGGRLCGCGGRGHLEAYASRTAITRVLLAELDRGRPSALTALLDPEETGQALRSRQIAEAVAADDPLVLEVIGEAADLLGTAIASVVNLINPPRIVLGGGLVDRLDLLLDRAAARAQLDCLPAARGSFDVVRAELGDDAGVVGAAVLAADRAAAHRGP